MLRLVRHLVGCNIGLGCGAVVRLCTAAANGTRARNRRKRRRRDADRARRRSCAEVKVTLANNVQVYGIVKATLADIKPGSFVGIGAMPQPDGSQKAIQVMIFAESLRGIGEGHRPWDRPGSTMTNGTVDTAVKSVDGQVLTVSNTRTARRRSSSRRSRPSAPT